MKPSHEQSAVSMNRSMPHSVVIPVLAYPDVREAVEWLCHSFGFVERLRIGDHRSQLSFGEGSVIVTGSASTSEAIDSYSLPAGGPGHSVMVRVVDVDSHYEHAKQFGARIISSPTDYPYGERQYTVEDLGGHRWTFSETVADVDPSVWGGTLFE
ncbi:MAG: VOC family protein [Acidobacteria bacterium]|nr:VOC family protein [Acidobacteriota bacterium]